MPGPRRNPRREARDLTEIKHISQASSPDEREQLRVEQARSTSDLREAQRVRVEQTGRRPYLGSQTGTHPVPYGPGVGPRYQVLHGSLDSWSRGTTVHENHLCHRLEDPEDEELKAYHIQRLVDLGAIKPLDGGRKPRRGPEEPDEGELTTMDDFEDLPPPTLNEATYSGNDVPTLPRVDALDVKPGELDDALAQGVGTSGPRPENPEDLRVRGAEPEKASED